MQTVQYNFQNPGDYTFPPSIEVDNEGMKYFPDQGIGKPFYVFEFKGSGINFKEGRYVPRVVRMEYADLEKVIGG